MCRISEILVILFLTNVICFVYGRGGGRGGGNRGSSSHSSSHSYSHPSPSYSHPSPSYSHPSPSYSHPSPSYSYPSPSYSHPSPSYSHPSPSYSYPSPSYSHPSPSYSHPSPSYSHPSPSYSHPSPSISHPAVSHPASLSYPAYHPLPAAPVYRPIGWNTQGSTNTRPIGFHTDTHPSSGPIGPPKQVSNVGSAHNGPEGTRPIGFIPAASPGHITGTASQPIGPPKTIAGVGNAASGSHYGEKPPAYNPHYNPAGYGSPSTGYNFPPPGYSSAGHSAYSPGSYHAAPAYTPHGTPGVTIVNNNHYHPPAYVPTYHYSTTDTGSSNLGFYLGYSLGRLTTPSFHYHSYSSYNGYYDPVPRYDHYTVHHYYHNSNSVPKEATIEPSAVVTCIGDTGSFCPSNTTSLCTNNGAVMCVANAVTTVPCTDVRNTDCVKSSVPCLNNTSPECRGTLKDSISVTIPCISTAKIFANVSYVNNTIVIVDTNANSTVENSTAANSTVDNSTLANSTVDVANSTIGNSTTTSLPVTTTPLPVTTTPKPAAPQTFCVTVLALPAERVVPEHEKLVDNADSLFGRFAVKIFGLA